jgi:hypothetical protein
MTAGLSSASHINGYHSWAAVFALTVAGPMSVVQTTIPDPRPSRHVSAANTQKATHASEQNTWADVEKTMTRAADPIVAEVSSYLDLRQGWDGENAAAPNTDSIIDACVFAQRLGMNAEFITATLDADGSVIFEIDDDGGSIMFRGNRRIVYALSGGRRGQVDFDGTTIPPEIMTAIS